MGNLVYLPNDVPALNSDSMTSLATQWFHTYTDWQWSRQDLVARWDESDRVYQGKRRLPVIDGMPFIDPDNPDGPDDIFQNINTWSMRMSQALFPKDDSWLSMVGRNGEDPSITELSRQRELWMHRQIGTREKFGMNFLQLGIRGTSAFWLDWKTETVMTKVMSASRAKNVSDFMIAGGMNPRDARKIKRVREKRVIYNGPVIKVLDMRDVLLDPEADLDVDRRCASIIQTYRRPSDLANELDDEGNHLYENLDGIATYKAAQLYYEGFEKHGRLQSLNMLGITPQMYSTNSTELVHVLVCYAPYVEIDGLKFWDTYFHVAVHGATARMIRVEESPTSASGARHFIVDTFIKWFTGHPYGISPTEKLVSIYDRAAYMDALLLSANSAAAYPAVAVAAGAFKDDVVDRTPGAINEISANIAGTEFCSELPSTQHAAEHSMIAQRWYSQKMAEGYGSYGATQHQDPTRSVASRETATAVNARMSSGNLSVDEQAEKFGRTQQEVCQWCHDMSTVKLTGEPDPDTGDQMVNFSVGEGSQRLPAQLKLSDFAQPRTIEILGLHGAISKQQNIQNKTQALEILGRVAPFLPNAQPLAQKLTRSVYTDLNIETTPEDWLSAVQLAAQNPQVQQMTAQNPQVQMMALVQGLNNPQLLQQALMVDAQMEQQAKQAANKGAPPNEQQQQQQPGQNAAPPGQVPAGIH